MGNPMELSERELWRLIWAEAEDMTRQTMGYATLRAHLKRTSELADALQAHLPDPPAQA